jgi:hypothetical protein
LIPIHTYGTAIRARWTWRDAPAGRYQDVVARTLAFVGSMRAPGQPVGRYAYQAGGPPLLYASCYAALTLHLCGKLQQMEATDRAIWADYIRGFQGVDGMFRDPAIACPLADNCDWWGWRHLTLHALMALSALGASASTGFALLEEFRSPGRVDAWLEGRNWDSDTCGVSNEVQNVGTLMQYARDYLGQPEWGARLDELFQWLDRRQDPASGLWGPRFATPKDLSLGIQSAYHFWMLYGFDRRRVNFPKEVIASCLRGQTLCGGFGFVANTSACEDIDTIDPLARLQSGGNARPVRKAALRALPWVLSHQNADGGWVFRRHEAFAYGHPLMTSPPNQSAMFPTWFRLLSLAYLGKILPDHPVGQLGWRFLEAPGHQFWTGGGGEAR